MIRAFTVSMASVKDRSDRSDEYHIRFSANLQIKYPVYTKGIFFLTLSSLS